MAKDKENLKLKAIGLIKDEYTDDTDPEEFLNLDGFKAPDEKALDKKIEKDIKEFKNLLDTLSTTEQRKKLLWKQIYENALTDRRNAFMLFGDLYVSVGSDSTAHAVHGQTLTKYMERMSKANEQLIKLADLVSEAVDKQNEENWSEDSVYDQFQDYDSKHKEGN